MTTKIYTKIDKNLVKEWMQLWNKLPNANYINGPQWTISVTETFKYTDIKIVTIYKRGKLSAVAPFIKVKKYGLTFYCLLPEDFVYNEPFLLDKTDSKLASLLVREIEKLGNVFVDNATAGFGQGIAITPIQTIRALATLGNGGMLVTPHVVDSIIYENGERKKIIQESSERVISKESSEKISRMLVHVVDHALKDGEYKMNHYSVAAKTGTAQMVKKGGGYYDDRYLHSFFGYFPAYDPKFIIFIFHTYPKGAEYASATLTDPFFKIVKFLISYYKIPPDR